LTFLVTTLFTGGIISYVHYKQVYDRAQLHKGIELEEERNAEKKRVNLERLQQQSSLEKQYREVAEK